MIACSANELDALSRRAARGAGLAWGLAEEAGKATHWLAVRGLPGVGLLARHLQRSDGLAYDDLAPVINGARWSARSGDLCPVIAGAALSDCARDIASGGPVTLAAVAFPLLLSAFLGRAARATGEGFEIRWPGVSIRCLPSGPCLEITDASALEVDRATDVTIRAADGHTAEADAGEHPTQHRPTGVPVAPEDWKILKALAARTYVPATEESRRHGAGAGLRDND